VHPVHAPFASAVIVAAGSGTRMGPGVDKLFLELAGRPIVAHTWARFDQAPEIADLVMVVRDGMQDEFRKLAAQFGFNKPFTLAIGGKERQDSVWNGLQALPAHREIVAIQDGARPCTSHAVIAACLAAARETGAAVAAQRVTDTIKESDGSTRVGEAGVNRGDDAAPWLCGPQEVGAAVNTLDAGLSRRMEPRAASPTTRKSSFMSLRRHGTLLMKNSDSPLR